MRQSHFEEQLWSLGSASNPKTDGSKAGLTFNKGEEYLIEIAKVLAWNIFQMDGIKFVIPNSCKNKNTVNSTLFGEEIIEEKCQGCLKNDNSQHNGIYARTYDWPSNESVEFYSAFIKEKKRNGKI